MTAVPALLLLAFFQPSPSPQSLADQGMKALDAQQWEAAAGIFSQITKQDDKDYSAWFNLAFAQSMLDRDVEAIAAYRKSLELKPGLYQAQLNGGMVLLRQSQHKEAVELLRPAAAAKPKEFRPVYYLADALLGAGLGEEAIVNFQSALAIDPNSALAEAGLGRALVRQNRLDEADSHFRKAAAIDPAFRDALLELADVYAISKQPVKAIELYKQFPENPAAKERLGELLLEQGLATESIPQLESAVASSPTSANRYALAMAYTAAKAPAKAEPLLRQVVADDGSNYPVRMAYARVLREQRKFEPAAEQFYRAAQLKPEAPECWSDLAGVLIMLERYQPALTALDKVRALGVEKPGHLFFRALIFDKNGMAPQALEQYQKFVAASAGAYPDEEWKAQGRIKVLQKEAKR